MSLCRVSVFVLSLAIGTVAQGQSTIYEYGSAQDLRGAKTFKVVTDSLKAHNDLVKRIQTATGMTRVMDEDPDLAILWEPSGPCATARVLRNRGADRKPLYVFEWEGCMEIAPAAYFFTRKFTKEYKAANQ